MLEPGFLIVDVALDILELHFVTCSHRDQFFFQLCSRLPHRGRLHSPWVADESDSGYVAIEAKENPRGAGSEPPIAEAVDFPCACTMAYASTEGSSKRADAI